MVTGRTTPRARRPRRRGHRDRTRLALPPPASRQAPSGEAASGEAGSEDARSDEHPREPLVTTTLPPATRRTSTPRPRPTSTRPRSWRACGARSRRAARVRWSGVASSSTALRKMLTEREPELIAALAADLGKPRLEAWATDVGIRDQRDRSRAEAPAALGCTEACSYPAGHEAGACAHRPASRSASCSSSHRGTIRCSWRSRRWSAPSPPATPSC